MAGINKDTKGWRVTFVMPGGKQKAFRLKKGTTKEQARGVASRVQYLIGALHNQQPPDAQTQRWVSELPEPLHAKLAKAGLVEARSFAKLGEFIQGYMDSTDVKESTWEHYDRVRRNLIDYFGEDCDMRTIGPAEATEFRRHLRQTLGENTVRRRCGRGKQFFKEAIAQGIVDANPFDGQKVSVGASRADRIHYIPREDAEKILEACPDAQWKAIFALCRFGGMRCPSEVLLLRWSDIDWERSRITFRSIKTEHHEGGETRTIPLFPELVEPLKEVLALHKPELSERVISRYLPEANLRTYFTKIVGNAGIKPWPKPFQNLRSTRETELMNDFPIHVVCKWIGNSIQVAAKHYLQVTEEHFQMGAELPPTDPKCHPPKHPTTESGKERQKVAINVAMQVRELGGMEENAENDDRPKTTVLRSDSHQCVSTRIKKAPPLGLEPRT